MTMTRTDEQTNRQRIDVLMRHLVALEEKVRVQDQMLSEMAKEVEALQEAVCPKA